MGGRKPALRAGRSHYGHGGPFSTVRSFNHGAILQGVDDRGETEGWICPRDILLVSKFAGLNGFFGTLLLSSPGEFR